jgi:hypothetical protein
MRSPETFPALRGVSVFSRSSRAAVGCASRPSKLGSSRARVAAFIVAAWMATACSESPTHPVQLSPARSSRGLTHDDSVARGVFAPSMNRLSASPAPLLDAISDGSAAIASVTPGWFQGASQPGTISATVTGNVNSVTVVGRGAILCSGNYGDLIGYDADGLELGRTSLQLIDASDCSPPDNPDDVTFGAQATLTVTSGLIARFEITPMSPLNFPVLGNPGGRASQTYTATLGVKDCDLFKDPSSVTDPLLKDPDVQKMLKGLADATKWDKPIEAQAEVGAWIMRNPSGQTELVPWPPVPGLVPNQCLSTYDENVLNGLIQRGYKVLAEVHTHPNVTSGIMYDQNGVKCMDVDQAGNIVPRPYDFPPFGTPPNNKPGSWLFPKDGPSDKDTKYWESNTDHPAYPAYVLEPGQIWRISNDGTGIPKPIPSFKVNKCVGNQP